MIPASRFKRFLAYMVDNIIAAIPYYALKLALPESIPFVLNATSIIIPVLYFCFFESSKHQATPGKNLFGLYVSTLDDTKITLGRALGRYLLLALPRLLPAALIIYGISAYDIPLDANSLGLFVGTIGATTVAYWWMLLLLLFLMLYIAWFIPIFFTKERKTVYDMLSGTRVCKKA